MHTFLLALISYTTLQLCVLSVVHRMAFRSAEFKRLNEQLEALQAGITPFSTTINEFADRVKSPTDRADAAHGPGDLQSLRTDMMDNDMIQTRAIDEVEGILRKLVEDEVIVLLQTLVNDGLNNKKLDDRINAEVKKALQEILPAELQNQVLKEKQELDALQRELYNAESRRLNRKVGRGGSLSALYREDGEFSKLLPPTLDELLSMNAGQIKNLMKEYGLSNPSEFRETNLNRVLQHIGAPWALSPL
jgi:uncharacterized coiled-coil protein SlyX